MKSASDPDWKKAKEGTVGRWACVATPYMLDMCRTLAERQHQKPMQVVVRFGSSRGKTETGNEIYFDELDEDLDAQR